MSGVGWIVTSADIGGTIASRLTLAHNSSINAADQRPSRSADLMGSFDADDMIRSTVCIMFVQNVDEVVYEVVATPVPRSECNAMLTYQCVCTLVAICWLFRVR